MELQPKLSYNMLQPYKKYMSMDKIELDCWSLSKWSKIPRLWEI